MSFAIMIMPRGIPAKLTFLQCATLFTVCVSTCLAEISLTVTAPLEEVEEGGVFSVHCQVSGLKLGQEITMLRTINGFVERLSLNEEVVKSSLGDRVFLATRLLDEGDTVYFLSIIDAERSDQGEYTCEVISASRSDRDLPIGSIIINVLYFPSESSVSCSKGPDYGVLITGDTIVLNCSSVTGNPRVDIKWRRASDLQPMLDTKLYTNGDRLYGLAEHTVLNMDDGSTIFVCTITNIAFPSIKRTCHTTSFLLPPRVDVPVLDPGIYDDDIKGMPIETSLTTEIFRPTQLESCKKQCQNVEGSLLIWIIATISAGLIALIFMVLVLVLLTKYRSLNSQNQSNASQIIYSEKIYDEVGGTGGKRDDNSNHGNQGNIVYMSLDKRDVLGSSDGHEYVGTNQRRF